MRRLLLLGAVALATACGGDPAGDVLGPTAVTTLEVQTRIFTPRCALGGCHVSPGAPLGLDLSSVSASRANTVDVPSGEVPSLMRVAPGNAPDSYLYRKVSGDPTIQGDPMPALGGPLNAAELALLRSWIEQGAR